MLYLKYVVTYQDISIETTEKNQYLSIQKENCYLNNQTKKTSSSPREQSLFELEEPIAVNP